MSTTSRLVAKPKAWLRAKIQASALEAVAELPAQVAGMSASVAGMSASVDDMSASVDDRLGALAAQMEEERARSQSEFRALRNEVLALTRRLNHLEDAAPLDISGQTAPSCAPPAAAR